MEKKQNRNRGDCVESPRNHRRNRVGIIPNIVVAAIAALLALPPAHAGDTVLKEAGADTKAGPCVINITAPKEQGECELALHDPAAKVKTDGWWTDDLKKSKNALAPHDLETEIRYDYATMDPNYKRAKGEQTKEGAIQALDFEAIQIEKKSNLKTTDFFAVIPADAACFNEPLNPEAGKSVSVTCPDMYTADELEQARQGFIKWARDWKNYRGKDFGKF